MKITIPVDKKSLESNVGKSFGRSPYFLIYDTETKETSFIENSAASKTGGAGIKAAQLIVDNETNVLITSQLGENAADIIKVANIKIFKSNKSSVKENIDDFIAEKLSILNEVHSGYHGRGDK